jgi:predicted CoA-binding protein
MTTLTTPVQAILENSPTVAVLGVHSDPSKPAHYVPAYLHAQGYRVIGVNPKLAGQTLFGQPVVAQLSELVGLPGGVDLVDVFRRPEFLPGHLSDILALKPSVVWLQLGIRHDAFAAELAGHGIQVVQDRCTLADHRRLGLGSPKRPAR